MAITAGPKLPLKRFDRAMLLGNRVHFLLDLTWAGRTWHLSRSDVLVKSGVLGEDLHYEGALIDEIEWEESIELFSDSADSLSFPFSAILSGVNVAELVQAGYSLLQAEAELSMWVEGTTHEDRRVLIRGRLADPEYGWEGEPVTASVQSEFFEDRALIPSSDQVITTSTWSDGADGTSAADDAVDVYYPIVFGQTPGSGVSATSMSIAYLVRSNETYPGAEKLLVAGHACDAGTVTIFSDTDSATASVSVDTDDLGRLCSTIDLTGTTLSFSDDDTFTVVWAGARSTGTISVLGSPVGVGQTITIGGRVLTATNVARTSGLNDFNGALATAAEIATDIADAIQDAGNQFRDLVSASESGSLVTLYAREYGTGGDAITLAETSANTTVSGATMSGGVAGSGGLQRREGGTLTGAGDLLEYLLRRSTVPCDWGRVIAAKPFLNRFSLAGIIAEPVSPFDFITSNLSPILPMSIVNGPYGLYPVPWRYDAALRDVVERIDADIDPSIELDGPVAYDGSIKDVVNDFSLSYALRQRTGEMQAVAHLSADRDEDDPLAAENVYCRQSQLMYGKRSTTMESTVIYDPATAQLVLGFLARAKCFPTRTLTYTAGYDRAWLERGDVVSITDSNLALQDQIALVEAITFHEDATISIRLRLVDDIAQSFHGS